MEKILIKPKNFFISSDYHLSHKNILRYDNRPFKDINHHDEVIINNHNEIVKQHDDFFFCGDIFFGKDFEKLDEYLSRLNGNKYFIKGNHDHTEHRKLYRKHGIYLGEQFSKLYVGESYKDSQMIVLNHFSMRVWDQHHRSSWHLFGHSHGSLEYTVNGKSMDVGIMQNNYRPFDFYTISKLMNERQIQKIDHHE